MAVIAITKGQPRLATHFVSLFSPPKPLEYILEGYQRGLQRLNFSHLFPLGLFVSGYCRSRIIGVGGEEKRQA